MSAYRGRPQPRTNAVHYATRTSSGHLRHPLVAAFFLLGIPVILLLLVLGLLFWHVEYGTEHSVTFKIAQVTNIATGNSHEYDIYTGEGNVLQNSDAWFHGKMDSANVQAWLTLHQGQVVTCPVYGFRIFIVSSKEDILDGCTVAKPGTPITY